MNAIIKPITPDGMCGFDEYGQLFLTYKPHPNSDHLNGTIIHDVRAKICPICNKGWINTCESLLDQFYLHDLDKHCHKNCMDGFFYLKEFRLFRSIFSSQPMNIAGFGIKELPNLYDPRDRSSWYEYTYKDLPQYKFIVGGRKRVFHLGINNVSSEQIAQLYKRFADQDVTKVGIDEKFSIHAWSEEDLKKYLQVMLNLVRSPS